MIHRLLHLIGICIALSTATAPCLSAQAVGAISSPPRPLSPLRPLAIPPIYGFYPPTGEILAIVLVESTGAVRFQSVQISTPEPLPLMLAAIRNYLRDLRFTPARLNGLPTADSVQLRFTIRPRSLDDRPLDPVGCDHCDPLMEAQRERVLEEAAHSANCARALREIARTEPTDTLAWAAAVVPQCKGAVTAAALAVRLMGYGRHPDSTHALRARIAGSVPANAVFDAAMTVAAQGYPAAQIYALEVLDRLQPTPRALGTLLNAPFHDTCGPFIVDDIRVTDDVVTQYTARVRELSLKLLREAKSEPLKKAAQCLLSAISP